MSDAAWPKQSGPGRWILLGCGILTGLFVLGWGSCAGIFYFVYKSTDGVAEVGAEYLRTAPEVSEAIRGKRTVRRRLMGWQVNVANEGGHARIAYDIAGDAADSSGVATVWLIRKAGAWSVSAARIEPKIGSAITIGSPPGGNTRIKWDD